MFFLPKPPAIILLFLLIPVLAGLSVAGVLTLFLLPKPPAIILLFLLILVLAGLSVAGVLTLFLLPKPPAKILLFLLIQILAGLSIAGVLTLFFLPKPPAIMLLFLVRSFHHPVFFVRKLSFCQVTPPPPHSPLNPPLQYFFFRVPSSPPTEIPMLFPCS